VRRIVKLLNTCFNNKDDEVKSETGLWCDVRKKNDSLQDVREKSNSS
jgi:hypothetical protein